MPRKRNPTQPHGAELKIPKELLDQLITRPITQGEFESIYRKRQLDLSITHNVREQGRSAPA